MRTEVYGRMRQHVRVVDNNGQLVHLDDLLRTHSTLVAALERVLDADGIEVDGKGWVAARTEARAALKQAKGE